MQGIGIKRGREREIGHRVKETYNACVKEKDKKHRQTHREAEKDRKGNADRDTNRHIERQRKTEREMQIET